MYGSLPRAFITETVQQGRKKATNAAFHALRIGIIAGGIGMGVTFSLAHAGTVHLREKLNIRRRFNLVRRMVNMPRR